MSKLFDINYILITIWGYPLSLEELLGTLFGLWSVVLAAKGKVSNFPVGIINVIFFFAIFYQVQMYSDMLLQVYFFVISVYGWWKWLNPAPNEAKDNLELKISVRNQKENLFLLMGIALGVVGMGTLVKNLNILLPAFFPQPAAFPYLDSFVAVASIAANYLLAKKKLESWVLWVVVDAFCTVLYYIKDIKLMSLEYLVFFFIASFGFYRWQKEYRSYDKNLKNAA